MDVGKRLRLRNQCNLLLFRWIAVFNNNRRILVLVTIDAAIIL
jgi:hypothetical protein